MKSLWLVCLLLSFCLIVSCASTPDLQEGEDPLTGTWVGDFGPAFYDRNTITLELNWDGKNLTGMVRPGVRGARMYRNFESFPIDNASFDSRTRAIKFEATYRPMNRHYIVEGSLKNNTLSGSWNRSGENDGDFKLKRTNRE